MWQFSGAPPDGCKFVAVFADGSGANVFVRLGDGIYDSELEEMVTGTDADIENWLFESCFFMLGAHPRRYNALV